MPRLGVRRARYVILLDSLAAHRSFRDTQEIPAVEQ